MLDNSEIIPNAFIYDTCIANVKKITMSPNTYVCAIAGSFAISTIALSPALFEGEIDGRILVGILWVFLGAIWWKKFSESIKNNDFSAL